MDVFRGILTSLQRQNRSGSVRAADADGRGQMPRHNLPKQHNSDWNTVVKESESANLFFRIFNAPSHAKAAALSSCLT